MNDKLTNLISNETHFIKQTHLHPPKTHRLFHSPNPTNLPSNPHIPNIKHFAYKKAPLQTSNPFESILPIDIYAKPNSKK